LGIFCACGTLYDEISRDYAANITIRTRFVIAGVAGSILATPTSQKARKSNDFQAFFYENRDFVIHGKPADSGFVHGPNRAYLGTDWARPMEQIF
jgi:hypothetical protein